MRRSHCCTLRFCLLTNKSFVFVRACASFSDCNACSRSRTRFELLIASRIGRVICMRTTRGRCPQLLTRDRLRVRFGGDTRECNL